MAVSAEVAEEARRYMDAHFAWQPVYYRLEVQGAVERPSATHLERIVRTRQINLARRDVDDLRRIVDQYPTGRGILPPYFPGAAAVEVQLRSGK